MTSVAISLFRSQLLKFLNLVAKGEEIEVTSRGRAIAKLVPPENNQKSARQELKKLARHARVGDVVSPVQEHWDAQS